nr:aminoglycoside phosphotransferase family protein [Deinococcus budaensis]
MIAHASLLRAVREHYGLELHTLTFLPAGTAPAYRAEGPQGRWFLKVLPNTPYGLDLLGRVRAEVPLLRTLRETGVLTWVPRLVPTRAGADLASVGEHAAALYEWIDAANLGASWTAAVPELAPLLGRLHAGTAQITARVRDLPVPPEDFGLPFEAGLLADLRSLEGVGPGDHPGLRALRDLLRPHREELGRLLHQARTFQSAARTRPHRFVVCHTDAHGGNVMRDAAGGLWLIDWETARLAPPEHDLWMLHARLSEVLPAYEEARGQRVALDPDVLGFYFTRRVLEDLAVDVRMILRGNTRPEEDEANLAVLERHILPDLARTDERLEKVRRALR